MKTLQKTIQLCCKSLTRQPLFFITEVNFNCSRPYEVQQLKDLFYGNGAYFIDDQKCIFLVCGAPNVGKSILQSKYVIQEPYFKINFRSHLLMNKEHFSQIISKSCSNLLINILQNVSNLPQYVKPVLEIAANIFTLKPKIAIKNAIKIFSDSKEDAKNPDLIFKKFIETMDFAVSIKKFLHGQKLIIFLDEINALKDLIQSEDTVSYIKNIMKYITRLAKEDRHVRVVLSGTDSFVTDWMPKFGLSESYFNPIYLGNLDKDESLDYMTQNLKLTKENAQIIYNFVGGHLYGINTIRSQIHAEDPLVIPPEVIRKACERQLETAMGILQLGEDQEGVTNNELLRKVWKELYSLKGEPIYFSDKSQQFREEITPLIRRNRFFKAGSPYISKDIKPQGNGTFLIANKPVDIHAMGILAKQISYDDVVKKCIN